MDEKTLDTLLVVFIGTLIEEAPKILKGLKGEVNNFFNVGIRKYLSYQKEKYSKIKTLLHGPNPVYLYDVYYNLNLIKGNKTISTESVNNVFKEGNYVTIIGDAGSGKSTLMKHLFLCCIQEKQFIPILIELRDLNEYKGKIENYIIDNIIEDQIALNYKILTRLLGNGKFIFFLDGFDEIDSNKKTKVAKDIISIISKYGKNKFILTSRPYSNIEFLPLFENLTLRKLNEEEIDEFIDLQLKEQVELASRMKLSIKETKNKYIKSFLTNPLLLSLYILTFQGNSSIPDKKYIFYRRVINALFLEHDSKTKLGFVRDRKTKLSQEEFEEILKRFCIVSFFDNRFDFDREYTNEILRIIKGKTDIKRFDINDFIEDLLVAIALWVEDEGILSFAHRSLQEYYAASFVKSLTEENKKKVYDKICISGERNVIIDVRNFISLCYEMDQLYFYKFLQLPILYRIKELLEDKKDEELVLEYLKIVLSEIYFKEPGLERLYPSKTYYYDRIIDFNLTEKIVSRCLRIIHRIRKDTKLTSGYTIKLSLSKDPTLKYFTQNPKLIEDSIFFKNYLNNSIENAEKYVKFRQKSDKEIVDII